MKLVVFMTLLLSGTLSWAEWDHSHTLWNSVLKKSLNKDNLVYYKKIKNNKPLKKEFYSYLTKLQSVSYSDYQTFTKDQKKAFLINAYNAFTIKLILDHYPVESIKDIGGWFKKPWDVKFFKLLDGKIESLDPIEHKWLRPKFKDYRIHAAVNCASLSCPVIRKEAFTASRLNEQLEDQMRVWITDSKRNNLNGKTLQVSKIFDWYESDFNKWGNGVKNILSKYSSKSIEEINSKPLKYKNYDWSLNKATP